MKTKKISVDKFYIGGGSPIALIAGPCVIESEKNAYYHAKEIKKIAAKVGFRYIFKASYDKANRSSIASFRGPGLAEGLEILGKIRKDLKVPVLSDVHAEDQVDAAAEVLDVIQIPAFLCRQTDILVKAARSGRVVNVKKGQFMAPHEMGNVVSKIESAGCRKILLTERGTSFGYNTLINDFKCIPIMKKTGYPVVYDATHSVQRPAGKGTSSGGDSEFIVPLSMAAVACGADALFLEVHENPAKALSDGPNMLKLSDLYKFLKLIQKIEKAVK
ncbi:MAG TPA: 3-deoxy-8-phosphooctulonate synthase [Candidatus Omnitrophota bacterium]|nr:3-deoxy-8-phosphooctulonate synthase [Candidatus Omnitrophota bacterium]HPS19844.1 3-deoxy-8-phosphooctulonate synthase [Candidatus Omnitrophota bacterium]